MRQLINSLSILSKNCLVFIGLIFTLQNVSAQKQMEDLDRGVLAIRTSDSEVLISWRILADEFESVSYNVYRGKTLLNKKPIIYLRFSRIRPALPRVTV